jgi:short chain dehydrogenase
MSGTTNKVVAITGASSGIGEATALSLAEQGATVVLGARGLDRLAALADRIVRTGGKAAYTPTDVRRRGDLSALVTLACERYGKLDVLVNNAGVMPISPLDDLRVEDWEEMIDVNIKGVLYGWNPGGRAIQLRSLVRLRRAINSGKRPPVRQWARADHGSEVFAHHGGGPEACLRRHLLDGQVRRFEQPLRATHARVRKPSRRRRSHLVAKTTAECSRAHRRPPRDDWQRELVREVLFHPCEQRRHGAGRFGWRRMFDELRLPTCAFERHHRKPRDRRRDVGAQVATNHVNAQIETGGGARRCQDAAVVHVEHVRVEIDGRMTTGKIGGGKPVRRGAEAVEDAGCRQHERPRTNRRHAGAALGRPAYGAQDRSGYGSMEVVDARHDDGVGLSQ